MSELQPSYGTATEVLGEQLVVSRSSHPVGDVAARCRLSCASALPAGQAASMLYSCAATDKLLK